MSPLAALSKADKFRDEGLGIRGLHQAVAQHDALRQAKANSAIILHGKVLDSNADNHRDVPNSQNEYFRSVKFQSSSTAI
jgi:hypothetical protein